ncbi:PIN domain-like protein [Obba rivulosa]|uniref:PIN domain-like protein n=1 Tax=Obba rivulosa TaxID=1052685 RepID=A0A8E2ARU0_9APHY|nr:PIN domain-like protein [Obba rivulosa]
MGVSGLGPFIQRICPEVIKKLPERLKALSGKTIVIDGTLITQRLHFAPSPHPYRHVLGWYRLVRELQDDSVKAICVFDGNKRNLAKAMENERRRNVRRQEAARGMLENERLERLKKMAPLVSELTALQDRERERVAEALKSILKETEETSDVPLTLLEEPPAEASVTAQKWHASLLHDSYEELDDSDIDDILSEQGIVRVWAVEDGLGNPFGVSFETSPDALLHGCFPQTNDHVDAVHDISDHLVSLADELDVVHVHDSDLGEDISEDFFEPLEPGRMHVHDIPELQDMVSEELLLRETTHEGHAIVPAMDQTPDKSQPVTGIPSVEQLMPTEEVTIEREDAVPATYTSVEATQTTAAAPSDTTQPGIRTVAAELISVSCQEELDEHRSVPSAAEHSQMEESSTDVMSDQAQSQVTPATDKSPAVAAEALSSTATTPLDTPIEDRPPLNEYQPTAKISSAPEVLPPEAAAAVIAGKVAAAEMSVDVSQATAAPSPETIELSQDAVAVESIPVSVQEKQEEQLSTTSANRQYQVDEPTKEVISSQAVLQDEQPPPAVGISADHIPSLLTALYEQYRQSKSKLVSLPEPPAVPMPSAASFPSAEADPESESDGAAVAVAEARTEYVMSKTQAQLTAEEGVIWARLAAADADAVHTELAALEEKSTLMSESYRRRTSPPTQETYEQCREILEAMGVPCIVSDGPYEAEALASALVLQGHADYVASEDTDVLVYEAPLVRNITNRRGPLHVISGAEVRAELRLDRAGFVDFALLLGTDFSQRIKNIGPQRALRFIRAHGTIERVLEAEPRFPPRLPAPEYLEQVELARGVFATLPPIPERAALQRGACKEEAVARILKKYHLQRLAAAAEEDLDYSDTLSGNYFNDDPAAS